MSADSASSSKPTQTTPTPSSRSTLLAFIALLFALIALGAAAYLWYQTRQAPPPMANAALENQIKTLENKIEESRLENQANVNVIKSQFLALQQSQADIKTNLEQTLKNTGNQITQRTLSQVAYLLHLANLHLHLDHDTQTATKLLNLAHQQLGNLDDPRLYTLKQSIRTDLATLSKAPKLDVANLVLQLDAINKKIQTLQVLPSAFKKSTTQKQISQKSSVAHLPWYRRFWHSLSGLQNLVTIRHHQQPRVRLLTPQEVTFAKENMQIKLAQAEWSVLHQRPILYQHSLQAVEHWLQKYFASANGTEEIVKSLKHLQQINVKPKTPDISNSLAAIYASMGSTAAQIYPKPAPKSPTPHAQPKHPDLPQKTLPAKPAPLPKVNPGVAI